jgi:hypothetical protein
MSALDQLLGISSRPLINAPIADGLPLLEAFGALGAELYELLSRRNGFYSFESALHVFPSGQADGVLDLATWNSESTWRSEYGDLGKGCLFFAEDAFGFQFCLARGQVCSFNAETGQVNPVAGSMEEWSAQLLIDFRVVLGHPLAHEWQVVNGALAPGLRLAPRTPFVLGGDFLVENLYAASQVELMRFRGYLANQIKDLPDGAKVTLKVTD